jgi:DNA-binding IclR family transcriptional regulator
MEEKDNKYQAPALDKGLDILEFLSAQSTPQSQTEIALGIDRSSNEIYRMLMSLENRGYILRDEISGKYKLSLKLYHLSHRHSPVDELRKAAQFPMDELCQAIRQSCHLSILYMNQVMVVIHSKSPGPISLSVEEGNLFPLILTASGKVLLAFMQEKDRENSLSNTQAFKDLSTGDRAKLIHTIDQIKDHGYYVMSSELADGVVDISVPIGQSVSGIVACLTISRLTTHKINKSLDNDKILQEAYKCAKKIEQRIGWQTLL